LVTFSVPQDGNDSLRHTQGEAVGPQLPFEEVEIVALPSQGTTNWVSQDNRNLFIHSSGG
jgi:hypothetical protein